MDTSEVSTTTTGDRDSKGRFTAGNKANPRGRPRGTTKKKFKGIASGFPEIDILYNAQIEVTMRLIDLCHSDDEAIALEAIKTFFFRVGYMFKLYDKSEKNLTREEWEKIIDKMPDIYDRNIYSIFSI